jgi:Flagellar hook-length control protein FliK
MDIVTAIKSQMLGQLIEALGKPSNGAPSGAAPAAGVSTANTAAPLGLVTGETVVATVVSQNPNGTLLLQIKGQWVNADLRGTTLPSAAREAGAQLQLKVDVAGDTPRLSFLTLETQAKATAQPNIAQITPATIRLVSAPTAPPPSSAPPNPVADILSRVTTNAATRQGSAAPLYADLAALTGRGDSALPKPLERLAALLLSNRLQGDAPITADALKQSIARSGVFQEAQLANGEVSKLDSKALLLGLRELLKSETLPVSNSPSNTEPPRRDGALASQKATPPTLANESDPKVISSTLARETDQAVERLKLHQIASLPDQRISSADQPRPQQLNFELPVALAQHTAMAGFRIERDKPRTAKNGQAIDCWGVRFAIDADVLGPVHAHVRLAGQTISVSLWAEQSNTHKALVDAIPALEAALSQNALDIGELAVFPGKPAEAKRVTSGHFLDRSS